MGVLVGVFVGVLVGVLVGVGVGVTVGVGVGVGVLVVAVGVGVLPRLTVTEAPEFVMELTVIVTPEAASVKICPASNAGPFQEVVVGAMSSRSLLLGSEEDARWTTTPLVTLLLLESDESNPLARRSST